MPLKGPYNALKKGLIMPLKGPYNALKRAL